MRSCPNWAMRGAAAPFLFLAVYTVIWTIFATLSDSGGLHHDMTEAYAWGREFQLGYYKHPPFWAWLSGVWFEVFPRENWAYYLLAALCAGSGVVGVWALAGLFTKGPFRAASPLLILLIPFFSLQAHRFNANLILVALWPWTVFFFVRSMEKRGLLNAVLFGVFAAAGLLSKYYTALLLLSCFIASFFHPNRKAYYRGLSPYVSVIVCAILVTPHVWWLTTHHFQTLTYVETRTAFSPGTVYKKLLEFILGCFALCIGVLAVVLGTRLWGGSASRAHSEGPIPTNRLRFAMILAFGPFLLTVLSALIGNVRLSTNFASPIFFLIPLVLIQILQPKPGLTLRAALSAAVGLTVAALLVSPLVPVFASVSRQRRDEMLMPAIAEAARAAWRSETEKPLRVVGGSEIYAGGLAFYSGENTSAFIDFDKNRSPWIKAETLRRDGYLALCMETDQDCATRARTETGTPMRERRIVIARPPSNDVVSNLVFRILISVPSETPQPPAAAMR